MRKPLFEKGGGITLRRIERIERIVTRLARRSRDVARAVITPFPISNAVVGEDIEGVILRYVFPCKGRITGGYVKLDKTPRIGVAINIRVFNDLTSESKSIIINRKIYAAKTDLNVFPGDCLEVSVKSEDVIKEVWISMLWTPDKSVTDIHSVLIDELEKNIKVFIEEETDA